MDSGSALIQELRLTLGRLESALSAIQDALAVTTADGLLLWCNQPFLELVGRRKLEVLGHPIEHLLPRDYKGDPLLPSADWRRSRPADQGMNIAILRQTPLQAVEISIADVKGENPPAAIYCLRDVSSLITYQELLAKTEEIKKRARAVEEVNLVLKQSELELARKIRECPVTGLPNRRALLEHLNHSIQLLNDADDLLAVLFCDLNRFKEINDAWGHQVGDDLLVEIGRRLRKAMRPSDMISRLGGDEFVVISMGLTEPEEALEIASRLHGAVGAPWQVNSEIVFPSMSIGIALTRDRSLDGNELLRRADLAMYSAKGSAPGGAEFYEARVDGDQRITHQYLSRLRDSLSQDAIAIHLQPIVHLATGRLHAHEVLARMQGRNGDAIAPGVFIPIAEKHRLISRLGDLVFAKTLGMVAARAGAAIPFSINVSPLEIAEPDYADQVLSRLAAQGINPGLLHLEVTESALISNVRSTATTLQQLREAGVKILLDDFGTGYSSLSLLGDLPTDGIKIDGSFTQMLNKDKVKTSVVQAVIQLCEDLGVCVIAEGIETADQLQTLKELGCEFGQGNLLGPPLPLETAA